MKVKNLKIMKILQCRGGGRKTGLLPQRGDAVESFACHQSAAAPPPDLTEDLLNEFCIPAQGSSQRPFHMRSLFTESPSRPLRGRSFRHSFRGGNSRDREESSCSTSPRFSQVRSARHFLYNYYDSEEDQHQDDNTPNGVDLSIANDELPLGKRDQLKASRVRESGERRGRSFRHQQSFCSSFPSFRKFGFWYLRLPTWRRILKN